MLSMSYLSTKNKLPRELISKTRCIRKRFLMSQIISVICKLLCRCEFANGLMLRLIFPPLGLN